MPGLIRGMARTAVVAGTATAVSNRVSRRQARRWAADEPQESYQEPPPQQYAQPQYAPPPPPPAPAAAAPDPIEQLKELASLKDQGILTDEEFAAEKAKILGR
jgi:Short C-terminal domain